MNENVVNEKITAIGYRDIFRQKEYMKLIIANVINRFGDSLDSVAFAWLVYALTNSAAWSAVIFGINRVPTIFLQPFTGAWVEYRNKKLIMIITDIIRGICVCMVAVFYVLGILNPWILLMLTLVISSAEAFRNPASTAVLPKILDKECYAFGISLNSTLGSVVEMVGLASAGAIIALFGTQTAVLIDAVTFLVSAAIILLIHTGEEKQKYGKLNTKEYFDTLKGGIEYIKEKRIIINFILLAMVANGILVPINSLMAPLVKNILMQGEYMLSVLSVALSVGLGIGSALYPYFAKKAKNRSIVFMGGMSISIYYLLLVLCGHLKAYGVLVYVICTASSLLAGICISQLISVLNVEFMKQVETEYLARAGAILNAGCVVAMPVVSFLVSLLTKFLTVSDIFYVVGGLGIAFFLFVFFKKVRFE